MATNLQVPTRSGLLTKRQRKAIGLLASYAGLLILLLLVGIPLFWMVAGSLKTTREIRHIPTIWLPHTWRWENFSDAWNAAPFGRFYLNTLITAGVGTAIKLTNAVMTAYALAFLKFPKKNLVFVIVLIGLMIPEEVVIVPNYITLSNVFGHSWINTYQGIIAPGVAVAFGTFMLRQAFLGLPREVLEAARIDGTGHLRMLWEMVIPMTRPTIFTLLLLTIVQKWNDFLWPLVVTNEDRMRTLTVGLTYLFDNEGNTQWGVVMAATIFVLAPLIVIFILAQKFIIEGITAGATKG